MAEWSNEQATLQAIARAGGSPIHSAAYHGDVEALRRTDRGLDLLVAEAE